MSPVLNTHTFQIAGIPVEFATNSERIFNEIPQYWGNFQVQETVPQLTTFLNHQPQGVQWTGKPLELDWNEKGFSVSGPGMEATYDSEKEHADLKLTLDNGYGDIFRMFFSLYLVKKGGILLHSNGMTRNRKTVSLFSGPSGRGKTTTSRLRQNRALLSDESIALFLKDGKTWATSTPFYGELFAETENLTLPVKHLFFIFQAKQFHIRPMSAVESVSHLTLNQFQYARCQSYLDEKMKNLTEMVKTFKTYRLDFLPTEELWDFLQKEVDHEI